MCSMLRPAYTSVSDHHVPMELRVFASGSGNAYSVIVSVPAAVMVMPAPR